MNNDCDRGSGEFGGRLFRCDAGYFLRSIGRHVHRLKIMERLDFALRVHPKKGLALVQPCC